MGSLLSKLDAVETGASNTAVKEEPSTEKAAECVEQASESPVKKKCEEPALKLDDPGKKSCEPECAKPEKLEENSTESGMVEPKSVCEETKSDETTKPTENETQDQPLETASSESHSETADKKHEEDMARLTAMGKPRTLCDMLTEASRQPLPPSPYVDTRTTSTVKTGENSSSDQVVTAGKTISFSEDTPSNPEVKEEAAEISTKPSSDISGGEDASKQEQMIAECVVTEDSDVAMKNVAAQDEAVAPVQQLAELLSNVVISTAASELNGEGKPLDSSEEPKHDLEEKSNELEHKHEQQHDNSHVEQTSKHDGHELRVENQQDEKEANEVDQPHIEHKDVQDKEPNQEEENKEISEESTQDETKKTSEDNCSENLIKFEEPGPKKDTNEGLPEIDASQAIVSSD